MKTEKLLKYLPFNTSPMEARDALRLALQSAIAAALCYGILRFFGFENVLVGILSAVLIVKSSVGSTFKSGMERLLASLVGSGLALLCIWVLPWGWGTAVSLSACMFFINSVTALRPEWSYGVVAAAAIALGSENDPMVTSLFRLVVIGIGAVTGIIVSLIVWPDQAVKRAENHLRLALLEACSRLQVSFANTRMSEMKNTQDIQNRFHFHLNQARETVHSIRFKRSTHLRKRIALLEKLYNSILIIHRVSYHQDSQISDGDSGIQNDSKKVSETACTILENIAENKKIPEDEVQSFSKAISNVKKDAKLSEKHPELNILRHSFIFGLVEIEESVTALLDSLDRKDH